MSESSWLPVIDRQACTGCGACADACQPGVIALVSAKAVVARPAACTYCAACEAACPVSAIALPYVVVLNEAK